MSSRLRSPCASIGPLSTAIFQTIGVSLRRRLDGVTRIARSRLWQLKENQLLTRFHVLEAFRDYSLVELQLETGRTHQIRVHMAYIGHPVAGDEVYGPRKTFERPWPVPSMLRHWALPIHGREKSWSFQWRYRRFSKKPWSSSVKDKHSIIKTSLPLVVQTRFFCGETAPWSALSIFKAFMV